MRLFLVALALAQATPRPSSKALRKAFEVNQPMVVEVVGPKASGAGIVVGAAGYVVTSVDFVGLHEAKVRIGDREHGARVVTADARLKVAVVRIETDDQEDPAAPAAEFRAAAVRLTHTFRKGDWLVGIARSKKGKLSPFAGQVVGPPDGTTPFLETELSLPPGSPLVDPQGKLVAIAVERRRRRSRALPIPAIKLRLTEASREAPARPPSREARPAGHPPPQAGGPRP